MRILNSINADWPQGEESIYVVPFFDIWIVLGVSVIIIGIIVLFYLKWRKRQRKRDVN